MFSKIILRMIQIWENKEKQKNERKWKNRVKNKTRRIYGNWSKFLEIRTNLKKNKGKKLNRMLEEKIALKKLLEKKKLF